MNLVTIRRAFLWCTVLNFAMLALWGFLLVVPHGWLHQIWGAWVRLTPEQFDAVMFSGMLFYKVLIVMFNAVPCLALWIVGRNSASA